MGKTTRWFKGLLGMKKDKENVGNSNSICGEKKEKRRWSFAKSAKDSGGFTETPAIIQAAESAWLRSYIANSEKEQNKHAIAVAAATAAAADAAIAAAHAAVAVVRLTSLGKGTLLIGGREKLAAVKIQTVFRGFLARKALRALKGIVRLQALVRGYLVRKRAAATLLAMQALFRAQYAVRVERARRSVNNDCRYRHDIRARNFIGRLNENRSEYHSKRLSSSFDPSSSLNAFDESPKIVEIDTCRPKSRSRRINTCMSEDHYYQSIPDSGKLEDFDWGFVTEDYKFATAQNTPRFTCSGRANSPDTPAKSLCRESYLTPYSNSPNYMLNTHSFRAKSRHQSAPRHRPEFGSTKRIPLNEIIASRSSFCGVRMPRSSCS